IRPLHAGLQGPALADVGVEFDDERPMTPGYFGRAVVGTVADHDDLVDARDLADRIDHGADRRLFIVGGDHGRDTQSLFPPQGLEPPAVPPGGVSRHERTARETGRAAHSGCRTRKPPARPAGCSGSWPRSAP